jgi:hypothetical protein
MCPHTTLASQRALLRYGLVQAPPELVVDRFQLGPHPFRGGFGWGTDTLLAAVLFERAIGLWRHCR